MTKTQTPLSQLSKKEFDEAYKDTLKAYDGKWDKYPLPTKEEIIQIALQSGEITLSKAIEFQDKNS